MKGLASHRLRTRALVKRQRELKRLVGDRTRDLQLEKERAELAREEAERLLAATLALTATAELEPVLGRILLELRRVVPYDSASVQAFDGEHLTIIGGGQGFSDLGAVLGLRLDLASGAYPNLASVVQTRAPVILADAWSTYPGFRSAPHAQAGVRSWLGVPLLFGDRFIGLVTLDKREPGFYTETHSRLAQAFAAQAAIAIENARLYTSA